MFAGYLINVAQGGSFFAVGGTNIILRDPRDYEGETQYARFLGPVVACKNINQFGREQKSLREQIHFWKNNIK